MNMHTTAKSARLYLRAELIAAQIRLNAGLRKAGLLALAGALLIMALAFLNIGLYAWLLAQWGPVLTPVGLGIFNIVIAMILFAAALLSRPGPELEFADEMRKLSADALENELKSGFANPFSTQNAAHLLFPAITGIIGAMRARKQG
ncbi:MAG: hypothetical protein WCC66_10780 [Rhizobiaceae bacterium]